jgi:hypothetical protein
MVRANGVDLLDFAAEHHRLVNQKLDELVRSRFSGQQFKFSVDPIDPSTADACGDLWGARRSLSGKNQV